MKFKFENLIVWQKAMDLAEDINKMSYKFPKDRLDKPTQSLKDLSVMRFAHWPRWLLACTKQRDVTIYQSKSSVSIMNMLLT